MTSSIASRYYWPLFFTCLLLPLLGSALFPLLFGGIVPVIGVMFFLAYRVIFKTWPQIRTPFKGVLPLLALLLSIMLASYFWAYNPDRSLERALKVIGLMISGLSLIAVAQQAPDAYWQRYKHLFAAGFFFVGAICAFELYFELPIYRYFNDRNYAKPDLINKNVAVFTMALPLALFLAWKSRSILLVIGLIALSTMLFFYTVSQASQLSMLVILIASFGCLSFLEKLTIRSAFLALGFMFMMMPWISPTIFDLLAAKIAQEGGIISAASTAMRLENWDFLSRRIMENPITGFGLDSTRDMTFETERLYFLQNKILHPHNIALQLWIEFGVIGCLWALLALSYFYMLFMRLENAGRRLGFITFATIMIFLLVSWSIWASWLVGLIFYVIAITVLATKTNNGPSTS